MMRSRAGYTLMELVVVLALLAVAAALVAPAVGRTAEDVMARAEVASVAAFLRVAREQAVTRQQTIEVSLDRDAHSLLLRRAARDGQETAPTRRTFSTLLRVESGATPAAITFQPQGMSSGARLLVETPGPRLYVVTVDALTGRVRTQRAAR
ncbi:MAG TPA: GspH/FimT family pseudopilin [Methylomirabilota bacterium]|jgi:prepilin-type N-terminal cleavage/methylation domain-containing protein